MSSESQHDRVQVGDTLAVDLSSLSLSGASGVAWGLDSPQLNANLVSLEAGDAIGAHDNDEVDVLLIVSSGCGELVVDDDVHELKSDVVVLVPRGATRSISCVERLVYYSVHARRAGLGLTGQR